LGYDFVKPRQRLNDSHELELLKLVRCLFDLLWQVKTGSFFYFLPDFSRELMLLEDLTQGIMRDKPQNLEQVVGRGLAFVVKVVQELKVDLLSDLCFVEGGFDSSVDAHRNVEKLHGVARW